MHLILLSQHGQPQGSRARAPYDDNNDDDNDNVVHHGGNTPANRSTEAHDLGLILNIHDWQLSKQGIRRPEARDRIAG